MKTLLTLGLAAAVALPGFAQKLKVNAKSKPAKSVGCLPKQGFPTGNLDSSQAACSDFYQFAAGGWLRANPMPSTESRWGTFNMLDKMNERRLEEILDRLTRIKNLKAPGSIEQQLMDLYLSFSDSVGRNQQGIEPIREHLATLGRFNNTQELAGMLAWLRSKGYGMLFSMYVTADARMSEVNRVHLGQGGLSLPDRDYYLKQDSASKAIRMAYEDHIAQVFALCGMTSEAKDMASRVLSLETKIAGISMSRTEMRDPDKTYNKMSWSGFVAQHPGFAFEQFRTQLGVPAFDSCIVGQPSFFTSLDGLLMDKQLLPDWRAWLHWHFLRQVAGLLSSKHEAEMFRFNSTVMSGIKQMKPLKERSVRFVNGTLGEPLGQLFVKQYFSPRAKADVARMVEELRGVFRQRIEALSWMSPETKEKAKAKLQAFTYKIGYPDQWRDFSKAVIKRGQLVASLESVAAVNLQYNLSKIGKPVDRKEWGMTPQTVNAYYSPNKNEIVFPAGILQPPFYSENAHPAMNYGGIGAVIGHEFSHGFDDKGSKYDGNGNLSNWWTAEDRKRFEERTGKIVAQFNKFKPIDTLSINGSMTQGENIADLAGLTLAFYAMENQLKKCDPPLLQADGFTAEQRFFLSWAGIWVNHISPSELRKRLITDPHSPGKYRILGPLANMPEFRKAFGCAPGSEMLAKEEDLVVIW